MIVGTMKDENLKMMNLQSRIHYVVCLFIRLCRNILSGPCQAIEKLFFFKKDFF
jgi:hypothetical protein